MSLRIVLLCLRIIGSLFSLSKTHSELFYTSHSLSLSLFLSFSLTYTHTHNHLSFSLPCTALLTHSFSHTHTNTLFLSPSLPFVGNLLARALTDEHCSERILYLTTHNKLFRFVIFEFNLTI